MEDVLGEIRLRIGEEAVIDNPDQCFLKVFPRWQDTDQLDGEEFAAMEKILDYGQRHFA